MASIEGCPDWVTLFPDQGLLAGMAPTSARGQTFFCQYSVTDSDTLFTGPQTKSFGLRLVVEGLGDLAFQPDLDLPGTGSLLEQLRVNTFASFPFPAAMGGVPPYTYAVTCAGGNLPPGMGFEEATRTFAGTPTAAFRDKCAYTATDSSQPADTVPHPFEVTVAGPGNLEFRPAPETGPLSRLRVRVFHSLELPAVTGGVPPYTYAITCASGNLPPGMGFEAATRTFAGTPTAPFRDSCAYTATDSSQPADTVPHPFEVDVTGPGDLDISIDVPGGGDTLELDFFPGRAVQHELPIRISGGVRPYTAMLDGCPDWVTLFPDQGVHGIIAGAPPRPTRPPDESAFVCRYVVTDSEPQTVSIGLRLLVSGQGQLRLPSGPADPLPLQVGTYGSIPFPPADSGIPPYAYNVTCQQGGQPVEGGLPPGMSFDRVTRIFAGTPTAVDESESRYACMYTVTDADEPGASASQSFEVIVTPLELVGTLRFGTRDRTWTPRPLVEGQPLVTLPEAIYTAEDGEAGDPASVMYDIPDLKLPLKFREDCEPGEEDCKRELTFAPDGVERVFDTPTKHLYQAIVSGPPRLEDFLCVDIVYHDEDAEGQTDGHASSVSVRVRGDAFYAPDGDPPGYQCPDPPPFASRATTSNPVHSALAPIHARRVVDVAHAGVRERVRGWSPEGADGWTLSPSVDVAVLSGLSGGFDYSGSSRSLRVGAEAGTGTWQTGLVAAFTETELRYRAEADLARLGYRSGEHDTGMVSLHPFVAWHAPSGGHLWMSVGAGLGELRHRDAPDFPSVSSSDVRLQAYGLEGTVPLADVLSGTLDAEAGIESFAFDIEGGGQISAALPTLRGHDYRAGLAWSSTVPGTPSVSLAYKQLTGDGPEGALVEAQGSVSSVGLLNSRLRLKGTVTASLGLGDHEQDSLGLGASARFAPDRTGRGFGLSLDTRLVSSADRHPAGLGVQGEAGYRLWGGPVFGMVRPYAGLSAYPGHVSTRRMIGFDLLDTPSSKINVEVYDHDRHPAAGLSLNLQHRF